MFAYLAPELGLDAQGAARRPHPLPEGWEDYVEASWDAWSLTFHRLRPVDETMSLEDLGDVLADLCRLMTSWLQSIGVVAGLTDGEEFYIFWTEESY